MGTAGGKWTRRTDMVNKVQYFHPEAPVHQARQPNSNMGLQIAHRKSSRQFIDVE
jgi:hypothetical protein